MRTIQRKQNLVSKLPTIQFDFNALIVVYQATDELWRGFCDPYGETTEAETKEEALDKIRELTSEYYEMVKSYGSPKHLMYAGLANIHDREVFGLITKNREIMQSILSNGKKDLEFLYVETYKGKTK